MIHRHISLLIIFQVIVSLFFISCKKSKDAELKFNRIGSFEIFGMKFGVDKERLKDYPKDKKKQIEFFRTKVDQPAVDVEQALVTVSQQLTPKVVNIETELTSEQVLSKLKGLLPPEYKDIIKNTNLNEVEKRKAIEHSTRGSGFVVSWDGYIATNAHFVDGAKNITITFHDGRKYKAKIVGKDIPTNIAVIKIKVDKSLDPIRFGRSEALRVGQMIVSIGNPMGLTSTVVSGIVSAKARPSLAINDLDDYIQISNIVSSASAGGPLVDLNGSVVGMTTSSEKKTMGMGLALPSSLLQNIVNQLIHNGKVVRSWFGAGLQELDSSLAKTFNYEIDGKKPAAVLVNRVDLLSPAEKAGIKHGDILVSYNNELVKGVSHFKRLISLTPYASDAMLVLIRDGKQFTKTVEFDKQQRVKKADVPMSDIPDWTGLTIGKKPIITQDEKTVRDAFYVISVASLSPAGKALIKPDDIILSINGNEILNYPDYEELVKKSEEEGFMRLLLKTKKLQKNVNRFILISKATK